MDKVIRYSDIDSLPSRGDFVDPDGKELVAGLLARQEPIPFKAISYTDYNEWAAGKQQYTPCIFGVLPDGAKVCVKISNPVVCVDVKCPSDMGPAVFLEILRHLAKADEVEMTRYEFQEATPFKLFHLEKSQYIRVFFRNLWHRSKFIRATDRYITQCRKEGKPEPQLATDDNDWWHIFLRETKLYSAGWNYVSNYTVDTGFKCLTLRTGFEGISKCKSKDRTLNRLLNTDRTLVVSWDIETHRTSQSGEVPKREDPDWTLICVSIQCYWGHNREAFHSVTIMNGECAERPGNGTVVVCDNEEQCTRAFCRILGKMQPDIIGAYNGGCFDWPIMLGAIVDRHMNFIEFKNEVSMIPPYKGEDLAKAEKAHVKTARIKLSAEANHAMDAVIKLPGMIDTDCMTIFMKLYNKAEVTKGNSLNYYLKAEGLDPKEDMPYKLMFRIYELSCDFRNGDYTTWDTKIRAMRGEFSRLMREMIGTDDPTDNEGRRAAIAKMMAEVAYYCKIDAARVQDLYNARKIVNDAAELATSSYTTMYDSFYHADGMRVLNYVGHYIYRDNMKYSNRSVKVEDECKDCYPGGHVEPPTCGLIDEPVAGEDFGSLYPNVIITNNFSPDRCVLDPQEAAKLMEMGYTLKETSFQYKKHKKDCKCHPEIYEMKGWFVHHRGAEHQDDTIIEYYRKHIDYSDKNGTKMRLTIDMKPTGEKIMPGKTKHEIKPFDRIVHNVYEEERYMSTEQLATYAAMDKDSIKRAVSYEAVRGRPALQGEYSGIFPRVVSKLFNKRVPLKKRFVALTKLREEMIAKGHSTVELDGETITLDALGFEIAKVDSKQKAVKVIANTTYGKSGDSSSPIYMLIVAGAITMGGQYNVKLVHGYVENKGFPVYYGDTDSVYCSIAPALSKDIMDTYHSRMQDLNTQLASGELTDEEYASKRKEAIITMRTAKVYRTMREMTKLSEELADLLLMDNGGRKLLLAYEEVLDRAYWCGKKKYFGLAHIDVVNYIINDKNRFIRGIDVVKQGQSDISRALGIEFIDIMLDVTRHESPYAVVQQLARKFYETQWPIKNFVLTARYKPQKKNVAVHKFVKRMTAIYESYMARGDAAKAELYRPPEPGDKFQYVIVKRETEYDIRGRIIKFGKGDVMEYLRVYQAAGNYEIDLNYYMEGQIAGILARYICFMPQFEPTKVTEAEDYKKYDKARAKAAIADIMAYCDQIIGKDRTLARRVGQDKRRTYTRVMKNVAAVEGAIDTSIINAVFDDKESEVKQLMSSILDVSTRDMTQTAIATVDALTQRIKIANLVKYYVGKTDSITIRKQRTLEAMIKKITSELYELAPEVVEAKNRREAAIAIMIADINNGIDSSYTLAPGDIATLGKFAKLRDKLYNVREMLDLTVKISDIVNCRRLDAMENMKAKMNPDSRKIAAETAKNIVTKGVQIEEYVWK